MNDISSYQYFKTNGLNDFGSNLLSNYLKIEPNGNWQSITQNDKIITNRVEWGKEYVKDKILLEITLYW
jgi:hypothetical protein